MLELLFFIFLFGIFGKLFFFGMRAAWSISKLLITIVFLPVILLGMVFGGLLYLAFRSCSLSVSFHCLEQNKVSK